MEHLYFIRLRTIDCMFNEYRCSADYKPRTIRNAIAPLVERVYEFKQEMSGPLFILPQWIEEQGCRKKLDEYDNVTLRIYEEKRPTIGASEAEIKVTEQLPKQRRKK